jgi:hypothetical protein
MDLDQVGHVLYLTRVGGHDTTITRACKLRDLHNPVSPSAGPKEMEPLCPSIETRAHSDGNNSNTAEPTEFRRVKVGPNFYARMHGGSWATNPP